MAHAAVIRVPGTAFSAAFSDRGFSESSLSSDARLTGTLAGLGACVRWWSGGFELRTQGFGGEGLGALGA